VNPFDYKAAANFGCSATAFPSSATLLSLARGITSLARVARTLSGAALELRVTVSALVLRVNRLCLAADVGVCSGRPGESFVQRKSYLYSRSTLTLTALATLVTACTAKDTAIGSQAEVGPGAANSTPSALEADAGSPSARVASDSSAPTLSHTLAATNSAALATSKSATSGHNNSTPGQASPSSQASTNASLSGSNTQDAGANAGTGASSATTELPPPAINTFMSCGGDPVGSWESVSYDAKTPFAPSSQGECSEAPLIYTAPDPGLFFDFRSDGTFTRQINRSVTTKLGAARFLYQYPTECVEVLTGGDDCQALPPPREDASVRCEATDTGCDCTTTTEAKSEDRMSKLNGTWTTSSSVLVLTDHGLAPTRVVYCVQGDDLFFQEMEGDVTTLQWLRRVD
jgi:hypothetical protein